MLLDPERVRGALGTRLGDRFLQYAHRTVADEAPRLGMHIDEHLAAMHGRTATATADDLRTAAQVASACKRLLMRFEDCDEEGRMAIVASVRYFLDTHDIERDDEPNGFADDARVVNYVAGVLLPELPPVQAP